MGQAESHARASRNNADSLKKEMKFMSEQLRRLGSDKLRLEKRVNDLQRSRKEEGGNVNLTVTGMALSSTEGGRFPGAPIKTDRKKVSENRLLVRRNSSGDGWKQFEAGEKGEEKETNRINYAQFMIPDESC